MTNYSNPITCPECGHNFPASEAFQSHIQDEAKKIASSNEELLRTSYEKKLSEVQKVSQEKLDEKANEIASPTKPFPIIPTFVLLILIFN